MTAEATLQPGSLFESYEILGELGSGGFGQVFKARQASTGQLVAVKILRPARHGDTDDAHNRIERFRRETRLCAELRHPNIVRLIDSGEASDGRLYAAFEFAPGSTLRDLLAAEGKLGVGEAVHLMAQVLDAISCAHARGIVHRDVKPENVMISKTGARRNALVLDFGMGGFTSEAEREALPRITATHDLLGTPGYAAPEQLRGEPASTRSDLYSWGLVFLECLTGERSYHGASVQEVVVNQLGPKPVPIPPWLRSHPLGRVLEIATAKAPEKRNVAIESILNVLTAVGAGDSLAVSDLAAEPVARERRQVTVVCCRFTVSAADRRPLDIEEIDHLLHARHTALAERATRAGGLVGTVFADRIVLAFGYPHAHEDDARRAARLAFEVARESSAVDRGLHVEVRIGIHTGLVVVGDGGGLLGPRQLGLTGSTPQVASYLVERASAGEVLLTADSHRLLRGELACEPAGECAVSELPHPLPVFRLTGARAVASETGVWSRETPLVGRASQLQQLLDGWQRVRAGGCGVVVVSGEPGVGKSRLLHELRQRTEGNAWLEWDCAPENQTTPLRPVVDALLAMNQPLEDLLTRWGLDLAENMPLFAAMLSTPLDERLAPLPLSAERQKELTLRAVVNLLFKMGGGAPLVLAIENLHWADPTTLELGALLVQELRTTGYVETAPGPRLFVICTTRAEFIPPWSGENVAFLPLDRLARGEVEEMVRACISGAALSPALVEQVVQQAEGVPLFVEEITRVVLDSVRAGEPGSSAPNAAPIEIPTSLRDLLTARLDGISEAARETAELAAVIGRDFSYEWLQAVSPKDEGFLREDLVELGRAGLVLRRRSGRGDSYVFRHALLRDAAYETMTRPSRQDLHKRVAASLRERVADIEKQRPEILASHFERGGEPGLAVDYWTRSASASSARAAHPEALSQVQHGLDLMRALPSHPENQRRSMNLLALLGTILMSTRGWALHETEEAFVEAWELCEALGEDPPSSVLWGIFGVETTRSDRAKIEALRPRWEAFSKHASSTAVAHFGESALGITAYWNGDFRAAHRHLERALRYYRIDDQYLIPEGGLYAYVVEAPTLWALGYADRARDLAARTLATAERRGDPYWIAAALGWGATVALERGEWSRGGEWAERLMALAEEQRLFAWWAPAACERGIVLLSERRFEEAIDLIRKGLERYRSIGAMCSYSGFLGYLVAAYVYSDRLAEAEATIEEGLGLSRTLLARFYEPELLRMRAKLLRRRGDTAEAESCCRDALAIAERDGSLAYGLRAATDLSRLLIGTGRGGDARELLAPIYAQFTEGFDTADLREAQELLRSLGITAALAGEAS